jgi:hypothetical protein
LSRLRADAIFAAGETTMKRILLLALALLLLPTLASAGQWCNDYFAVLEASYTCTSPCGSGPCDTSVQPAYGGHPALGYEGGPSEWEACANANTAMCNDIDSQCGICGSYYFCAEISNYIMVLAYEEPGLCVYSGWAGWCGAVNWQC